MHMVEMHMVEMHMVKIHMDKLALRFKGLVPGDLKKDIERKR